MPLPLTIDVSALLDEQRVSRFHIVLVVLCAGGAVMEGLDLQSIGYVGPSLAKAWHLHPGGLAPVFGAALAAMIAGGTIFGVLGDRLGRKRVILGIVALFGVATLLTATAQSMPSLIAWRFLAGLGLGGVMPNMVVLVSEYSPKRARGKLVMLLPCSFNLGGMVGGLLAAKLIPAYGWPAQFVAAGVFTLALLPLLAIILPSSIRQLALRPGEAPRIRRILQRMNPALSFPEGSRFTVREDPSPGFPIRELFRHRRAVLTTCFSAMLFMNMLVLHFLGNWLPTVINNAGFALAQAVLVTSLLHGGGMVGNITMGILMDRLRPARLIVAAFLISAGLIGTLALTWPSFYPMAGLVLVLGFWCSSAQVGTMVLASTSYPTAIRSTGVGWVLSIGHMGSVVGPVAGGLLLALRWPVPALFLAIALPPLLGAAAALTVGRQRARAGSEPAGEPAPALGLAD